MKVKIQEIRKICEKVLTKNGVKLKNAKIIVDDFIEGELLDKTSHGLLAFVGSVYDAKRISKTTNESKIKIVRDRGATALINGNKQAGQLVAKVANKLVIKKAKKYGIGIVGTYKAKAILRPGSQAEQIARHDLIGLIFHNGGGPLVAPYGGIDAVISTDPIGYAIPTSKFPIVVDMAISERAWGEVRIAKKLGHNLPKNAYLDKKGNIAKNPDEVFSAIPFGGYKGYALGIFSEILSGSLVGNGVGFNKLAAEKNKPNKKLRGAIYMAIDPSKFVSLNKFKKDNTQLVKELKNSRRRKGVKEILVPGERAYGNKAKCLKRGWFDVDKKIIDKLYNL